MEGRTEDGREGEDREERNPSLLSAPRKEEGREREGRVERAWKEKEEEMEEERLGGG